MTMTVEPPASHRAVRATSMRVIPLRNIEAALAIAAVLAVQFPGGAVAQSMTEALTLARGNSPQLGAADRALAAVQQRLPQARSGYLPQLDLSTSAGVSNELTDTQEESFSANANASLNLTQPLYRGGGTVASVDQAGHDIRAEEETFEDTEQTVLLETATAYMNVWRDQKVTGLIGETLSLLTDELNSVSRQKELGAATATDVAQTEVRLGQIEADQIDAEAALTGSRAQFERLTGVQPASLDSGPSSLAMPASADDAVGLALADNPALNAATFRKRAAERATDVASAQYWPSLDLRSALQYFSDDIQENGGEIDDDVAIARVELRLNVPLYRGASSSIVREQEEIFRSLEQEEEDIRRRLEVDTRGAWNRMTAARERIGRLETAVDAARRVIGGVEREYQLGKRTTLDLLNARQDLLDLQTALINVQHDLEIARFDLMVATGRFTSGSLGLGG